MLESTTQSQVLARFGSTLLARISNTDLRSSSPSRRLWHLGDAPVAVLAVDVGLSIDQHAVGQFEHQDLRIVQSPTGQVVAEFEPARLVNVPRPVADPEHPKDLEFDLVVLIDPDPF